MVSDKDLQAMLLRIHDGARRANSGYEGQQDYQTRIRGVAGVVSDWWHDVELPNIEMWSFAKQSFASAERALSAGDPEKAQRWLDLGERELADAKREWKKYTARALAGAEDSVSTLQTARDVAVTGGAGVLTAGTLYLALGGGALVTAGATLVGAAVSTRVAERTPTLGPGTRGTLEEIRRDGVVNNLKLAAHGVAGMIMGTGEALSNIPAGLASTAKTLRTLFTDPAQFAADVAKLRYAVEQLWEHRQELFRSFEKLTPEQQSYAVGRWVGQLEALLIAAQAGKAIGGGLQGGIQLSLPPSVGGGGPAVLGLVERIVQIQADVQCLAPAAALVTASGVASSFKADDLRLFQTSAGSDHAPVQPREKSTHTNYSVKKSDVKVEVSEQPQKDPRGWNVLLVVEGPGGKEFLPGSATILIDAADRHRRRRSTSRAAIFARESLQISGS